MLELYPQASDPRVMTQRVRAEHVLQKIRLAEPGLIKELEEILDEAQNGPPLGLRDGSINEFAWLALRDLIQALKDVRTNAKTFRETIS